MGDPVKRNLSGFQWHHPFLFFFSFLACPQLTIFFPQLIKIMGGHSRAQDYDDDEIFFLLQRKMKIFGGKKNPPAPIVCRRWSDVIKMTSFTSQLFFKMPHTKKKNTHTHKILINRSLKRVSRFYYYLNFEPLPDFHFFFFLNSFFSHFYFSTFLYFTNLIITIIAFLYSHFGFEKRLKIKE